MFVASEQRERGIGNEPADSSGSRAFQHLLGRRKLIMQRINSFIAQHVLKVLAIASVVTVAGCTSKSADLAKPSAPTATRVVVTSLVAEQIALELAESHFEVSKVVPDDTVSRLWTPKSDDVKTMQNAGLILLQGAGYDPWKDRATLPGSRLVDVSKGIYSEFIRIPDAVTHQHGPEGKHSHPGTVWATWLNPELVLSQVSTVESALTKKQPDHADAISKVSAKLRAQIQGQQEKVVTLRKSLEGQKITLLADNSNYRYLAKAVGLECRYLHWPESEALSTEHQAELETVLKESPSDGQKIFLLDSRQAEATQGIAEAAGLKVVRIDVCEHRTDESVWMRLAGNIERLASALQQSP